ncbi:MAG: hypothetical protein EAZ84_09245 [Verrucomicrobia bacterium]|nr:MAG: hypothetical protein EAZ84_09245 [Verrucomicrobiota bacterium]TAE85830.1 MAG: hypothetical protein EAZ82_12715 [Verrucomicrobiota bacterium]TAF23357.1 MAG: hypothetical protein EAZ71_12820 [Verrucomicrobiota bacterium]
MPRLFCCLALTLLAVSCAPTQPAPDAEVATDTSASTPNEDVLAPEPAPLPEPVQQSGMRVPDLIGKLPDKKDMTPSALPSGNDSRGPAVIAVPPSPANSTDD